MTEWHKYIDEKPKMADDFGLFFLTLEKDGKRFVADAWWDAQFRAFATKDEWDRIVAWARVNYPKPYMD